MTVKLINFSSGDLQKARLWKYTLHLQEQTQVNNVMVTPAGFNWYCVKP